MADNSQSLSSNGGTTTPGSTTIAAASTGTSHSVSTGSANPSTGTASPSTSTANPSTSTANPSASIITPRAETQSASTGSSTQAFSGRETSSTSIPESNASARSGFDQTSGETESRPTGGEVELTGRPRSRPNTAVIVGSALAGAIAGGAIPFMLSGLKRSTGRSKETDRSDLHVDHGDVAIDARSNKSSAGRA